VAPTVMWCAPWRPAAGLLLHTIPVTDMYQTGMTYTEAAAEVHTVAAKLTSAQHTQAVSHPLPSVWLLQVNSLQAVYHDWSRPGSGVHCIVLSGEGGKVGRLRSLGQPAAVVMLASVLLS
jgi:hypothetical protein